MVRVSAIDVLVRMKGASTFAAQAKKTGAGLEAMGIAGAKTATSLALAGQKMQAFGATMTKRVTAPVVLGLGLATKSAIDFNGQMERLTTQAGDTQRQTDSLSQAIVDFSASGKTAFGPQTLSEAAFHAASQGFHNTADAMDLLTAAADGAEIGNSDLVDTTKVLGQTMKAFNIPASQARKTMSQFNTIVGHGDMTMSDLVTGMQTGVVPIFAQANLSLKDLGGAMDVLTSRTFTAAKAGTGLKMAVAAILAPSDKARGILHGLGVDVTTLQNTLQTKGLPAAIGYLNKQIAASGISANKVRPELISAFGGGRTGPAILTLIQHLSELRKNVKGAGPDVSKFDKQVAHWAGTQASTLGRAKARLEGVGILIGQHLAPVIASLAGKLGAVFGWFSKLPAPVRDFAVNALLALAAVGPLTWALGFLFKGPLMLLRGAMGVILFFQALTATMAELDVGVITATSAMIGFDVALLAIPLAIAAIAIGLVVLYLKVKWFRDAVNAVIGFIVDHWKLFVAAIPFIGPPLLLVITQFGHLKNTAVDVFNFLKSAPHKVASAFNAAKGALVTAFHAVRDAIKAVIQKVQDLINKITGPLKDAVNWVANNTILGPAVTVHGNAAAIPPDVRRAFNQAFGPGSVPKRAGGGPVLPGGTALVGERGPELASFPFGAQITDANKTAGLLSSARDNLPPITIPVYLDGKVIAQTTVKAGETAKARK